MEKNAASQGLCGAAHHGAGLFVPPDPRHGGRGGGRCLGPGARDLPGAGAQQRARGGRMAHGMVVVGICFTFMEAPAFTSLLWELAIANGMVSIVVYFLLVVV